MAKVDFLYQGLHQLDKHENHLNDLLALADMDDFIINVAFARASGINLIKSNISLVSNKTKVFMGINNNVTSIQAINELLKLGIKPFVVDTGSTNKIFHPKIYLGYNSTKAEAVLGSSNLTEGGLNRNIEASTKMLLDRSDVQDNKFVEKIIDTVNNLPINHPNNVFQINSIKDALRLLKSNRLEDERNFRITLPKKLNKSTNNMKIPPMTTYETVTSKVKKSSVAKIKRLKKFNLLVWESNGLTERDLNIPRGGNTNPTGSMYFKKGALDDVDQRHYFKDVVFNGLTWNPDSNPSKTHLLRATANFEIIINGTNHGIFNLKLTHNSKTNTTTYRQNNAMTQVHWGADVKPIIADRTLINKIVKLYKNGNDYKMIIS